MRILVDTNVLARVAHKGHPRTPVAQAGLQQLWKDGHELRVVPQVLYEYWSVASRPLAQNGLGFSAEVVDTDISRFKRVFSVLRDERGVLERWQQIVRDEKIVGKRSHDARLVAAMLRHGLTHLLTFNVADFQRYREVTVLDPHAIATA